MMRRLEMPELLAGCRVQRDEAITEEIVSKTLPAIEIVGRRSSGNEDNSSFVVHRCTCPRIVASRLQVSVLGPRLITFFAGMWNGVECPEQFAGPNVPAADIARRCRTLFADAAGGYKDVFIDTHRTAHRDAVFRSRSAQIVVEIDFAVHAEAGDDLAGVGIQGDDEMIARNQDAPLLAVRPIANTARVSPLDRRWIVLPFHFSTS